MVLQEASESCYQTIKKSWSEIDEVASKPGGLSILSKTFKTCKYIYIYKHSLNLQLSANGK